MDPHTHHPAVSCGIRLRMLTAMTKVRTKVWPLVMAWKLRFVIKSQRKLEIFCSLRENKSWQLPHKNYGSSKTVVDSVPAIDDHIATGLSLLLIQRQLTKGALNSHTPVSIYSNWPKFLGISSSWFQSIPHMRSSWHALSQCVSSKTVCLFLQVGLLSVASAISSEQVLG